MVVGVVKVFVKEKVLVKRGVGCVKVLVYLSLLRATRGSREEVRGEGPSPTGKDRDNWRKRVAGRASRSCRPADKRDGWWDGVAIRPQGSDEIRWLE